MAARAGGAVLREHIGTALEVRYKGEIDVVTQVDDAAEAAIVEVIRRHYPNHRILAEEGSTGGDDPHHRWIIDPLDGTTNYSHGLLSFAVSVGYERDGRVEVGVIYDPNLDELFVGERGAGATVNGRPMAVSSVEILRRSLLATGFPYDAERLPRAISQFASLSRQAQAVRRIGSAALDMAYVAAGRFDAYWEDSPSAWDIAAGIVLVEEAGGKVTELDGAPVVLGSGAQPVLASNGRLHLTMIDALSRAEMLSTEA